MQIPLSLSAGVATGSLICVGMSMRSADVPNIVIWSIAAILWGSTAVLGFYYRFKTEDDNK